MKETNYTPRERAVGRRYVVEIALAGTVYALVLLLSLHVLETARLSPLLKALVAAAPAIPVFAIIAAFIRFLLSIDELQRQIHLEALAVAAGITAALAMTYTFLEGVGLPHSQAWWAFVCLDVSWGFALPFVKRRYA